MHQAVIFYHILRRIIRLSKNGPSIIVGINDLTGRFQGIHYMLEVFKILLMNDAERVKIHMNQVIFPLQLRELRWADGSV